MAELFNVNTFLVSQVNPHVCPFVSVDTGSVLDTKGRKRFTKCIKSMIGNNVKYWISQLHCMGLFPSYLKGLATTINQSYKGHVTVVPSPTWRDYTGLLDNVSRESY
jgi:TAG lipase/steryl ester hydrolase/phospholipase A2/LPA acyltransferase